MLLARANEPGAEPAPATVPALQLTVWLDTLIVQLDSRPFGGRRRRLRIVKESATELVLERRPVVLPTLAGALVLAVLVDTVTSASTLSVGEWVASAAGISVGGLITYLMALRSRVVFDAAGGEVRWRLSGWPGGRTGACPLTHLKSLQVLGDQGPGGAQGLALVLASGDSIPVSRQILGVQRDPAETSASVREWLARQGYDLPSD